MNKECVNLAGCGFFKKYGETKDLACRGFIASYCRGEKMKDCKRLQYKKDKGIPPSDDMMPSGQIIAGVTKV
ncbi:hypothetical protein [Labilibacter marinus]|uniref:hypothetical protein n=1 Tax=Labilibacter marinus TaxID=1477105 RepID=UPI00094FFA26|nr:hypothetical protein [Labilibacter marinus]